MGKAVQSGDIEPEKARTWELGSRYDDGILRAELGAFLINFDNLATGTRYTDAVIQAQFQRIQEELNRNPVLGKSLVKRATLFVKHVGDYRQQHRAEPEAVLKELLASSGR